MCPFCETVLMNNRSLCRHRSSCAKNPEIKNTVCKICRKVVKEDSMKTHLECHEPREGKYPCEVCGKLFLRERYVIRHKKLVHDSDLASKQSICPICGAIFKSQASCNLHVKRHDKKDFKCDMCEKVYKDKSTLQEHLNIHFDVKPYKCEHCDEFFHSSHKRSNHMYQRHVPKRFQCNVCSETFKSKRYMQAHVLIHTGELPFLCTYCNKGFRSKEILRLHTKIHKKVFDHICPICDKRFVQRCNMVAHSKTHFRKQEESMNLEVE